MNELADFLWSVAVTVAGVPVTWVEVIGFVSGVWCVWLVGRQNPLNWPIGLIQVLAYLLLFWQAGLFADSALQVVYLVLGLWGWWNWLRHRQPAAPLVVRRTDREEWIWLAIVGAVGAVAIIVFLDRYTSSTVPIADGIATVLSLLATYGQGRKLLESWWLWIAADVIYVPLYFAKDLWLTALLYGIFLGLCVIGLRRWKLALVPQELSRIGAAA